MLYREFVAPLGTGVQFELRRFMRPTNYNGGEILHEIDVMVLKARQALEVMKSFTQEQVDKITEAMSVAGSAAGDKLAEMG